jgi:DNA-binding transcriptional MerR regulator
MRLFSIKELERISSVKAHTIRIWEKRFQLLNPVRIGNNVRCYSLADVLLLMDIDMLLRNNHKISKIALLPHEEIRFEANKIETDDGRRDRSIRNLVSFMFDNNIDDFEKELNDSVLTFGIKFTIGNIIMPFLEKVNLTSYKESTIEAHFVVTAVRKKIILGIEQIKEQKKANKSILLFLPEEEHYDLILLYQYYLMKESGFTVYYLGTNITAQNLSLASEKMAPDYLGCYIADKNRPLTRVYFELLSQSSNMKNIFVTYSESLIKSAFDEYPGVTCCRYNLLLSNLKNE